MNKQLTLILWLSVIVIGSGVLIYIANQPKINTSAPSVISSEVANKPDISAIVVPHFDFAKDKRRAYLATLKDISPKNVLVVSVNHFGVGQGDFLTTTKQWSFANGSPVINADIIESLTSGGLVGVDEGAFLNEHGISTVLADAFTTWPNAQFAPIIIKDTAAQAEVDVLITRLTKACLNCLLVLSIDFSHYNPDALAHLHDEMSLRALANVDSDLAWKAETDSPQLMYMTIKWAEQHNTPHFILNTHSNSGSDQKAPDIETTSFVLGHYTDTALGAYTFDKSTTVLIGGDMMFDRGVNHQFKDKGGSVTVFSSLGKRVFWGVDVSIANLEGPISDAPIDDDTSPKNLKFNFPPDVPKALNWAGITTVSSANNHSLNNGQSGLANTKQVLAKVGVTPIGQEDSFNDASIKRFDAPIPLTVIALNMVRNLPNEPVIEAIKKEKLAGNAVLVFPHWGNEYAPIHSGRQQELAHAWIDAGAELIIGAHPHVIQDMEIYKNSLILYSVGNLVFDQTFSAETQTGLLVGISISTADIKLSFLPIGIQNMKPQLLRGKDKTNVIEKILNIDNKQLYEMINANTLKITRSKGQ